MTALVFSHKVDGTELNDGTLSFCRVPEVDNGFAGEDILIQVQGDVPWFHRIQPREGQYTFLIDMGPCEWATYQSKRATLDALFSPGPHIYTHQVRGAGSATSCTIICDGGTMINVESRSYSVVVKVPDRTA